LSERAVDEHGYTADDWRALIRHFNFNRISAPLWMAKAARKSQLREIGAASDVAVPEIIIERP
jgi:hypothetical protein